MYRFLYLFFALNVLMGGHFPVANAQSIPLQNLTASDLNQVVGDLGAAFMYTSVSGAAPLGHIFGFEIGVIGADTSTTHLQSVAQASGVSGADAGKVPNGELLGVLSIPLGFTAEVGVLPKLGSSGFSANTFSVAGKWSPSELYGDLPLSVAAKVSYSKTDLSFNSTINGNQVDYSYSSSETALTFLVSKNLIIFEPYAGFGVISTTGDLSASGTGSLFNSTFTTATSATATRTGTVWMVGTEVKLLVLKLGAEYANAYNTGRFSGKLSFYF